MKRLVADYLLGISLLVIVARSGVVGIMEMKVGVIVDLNSWVGKMDLSCINISFSDFYASHPNHNTSISLHIRDSKADPLIAATQAMELIQKNEVKAILGPENWAEAYFIKNLGEKAKVPIITFTPPTTTTTTTLSYSFQISQSHSFQVQAITQIITTFKWKHVVTIYNQDDQLADLFAIDLTNALQDSYIHVQKTLIHPTISSNHIKQQLYRFTLRQARVFVVNLEHNLASRFFATVHKLGMMREGYVWILTSTTSNVLNSLKNSSILYKMQGVLGVKTYVPKTFELQNFTTRWRRNFQEEVNVNGLWAYDGAWGLAMAIERIGRVVHPYNFNYGKKIRELLLKTKFKGLSGEVNVVNKGRLKWGNLEIVNVLGNRGKRVGFWRPKMGLSGKFNQKSNLSSIIWPGYSVKIPKGYGRIDDTNLKRRLKVGVAMNDEFNEFASQLANGTMVGYCIDIFKAVVDELPYELLYDFVPFRDPWHGHESVSYDHLILQVSQEVYDIAIGDITILEKRSKYVDFNLPFTEARLGVVIPAKRNLNHHEWVFLKPLNLKLWITSLCFFIFMGFAVWILEHRNHRDSRGPRFHKIGSGLWITLCTIVFARWDTLASNLSRFVVVILLFVVFVLTQSYTASLTSWLTVQQLQQAANINYIIKNNWRVGYQGGSYVMQRLEGLGIKNLIPYHSMDHLHNLFANESFNGCIDAVIDEFPYMQLFLARYPDDYILSDSLFNANGFGFAFPIGSSIADDMSRAVLKVTEGDKFTNIQDKWFAKKTGAPCCSPNDNSSSSQLDLSYFWILFLIAGSAAIIALVLYFFISLHNRRQSIRRTLSNVTTMWKRISSHIFKVKGDDNEQRESEIEVDLPPVVDGPSPPSPSDDSIHSSKCFTECEDITYPNKVNRVV